MADIRRRIPSVQKVLRAATLTGNPLVTHLAGEVLEEERRRLSADGQTVHSVEEIAAEISRRVQRWGPGLAPVVNATGVVVHTNLGRAPLSRQAAKAAHEAATGYTDLEVDLESGRRSSRLDHVSLFLKLLTGAEDHLVVNNNAAGLFLALFEFAKGREVVISRGELVEIGGSFRIPDIMAASGARLVEVGTTNRTRLADYARAIGSETAALMKVHPSNFRQTGFVESAALSELKRLKDGKGIILLDDLGSGSLLGLPGGEPTVRERLAGGSDLVFFSGDKLLGGPQAGIVAGRAELISRMRLHPLFRALRPDKMTLAALRATLYETLVSPGETPVRAMLTVDGEALRKRAVRLRALLRRRGVASHVVPREGASGGGSLPEVPLPGWAVAPEADPRRAGEIQRRLRLGSPAVLSVVDGGSVILDVRTVSDEALPHLADAVARSLRDDGS